MKLILKKYGLATILSIFLFTLILLIKFVQKINITINDISLLVLIISATCGIRIVDDVVDYNKDIEENKKVIPLFVTLIIGISIQTINIIASYITFGLTGLIMNLIYISYLIFSFMSKSKVMKIFIYPMLIFIAFYLSNILFNPINVLILIILILFSILLSFIFSLIKKG